MKGEGRIEMDKGIDKVEKNIEKLASGAIGFGVGILLFVTIFVAVTYSRQSVLEERLSNIQTIAQHKAYDQGDTTDMWWAVVEIARGE